MATTNLTIKPRLARFREGARILGVSETQIRKWTRPGPNGEPARLRVVSLPGIRAKRLIVDELEAMADQLAETA